MMNEKEDNMNNLNIMGVILLTLIIIFIQITGIKAENRQLITLSSTQINTTSNTGFAYSIWWIKEDSIAIYTKQEDISNTSKLGK